MDASIGEQFEDDRKAASRPRSFNTIEGRVLGEVKHLRAVGEHRGTPLAEIQPSRIHSASADRSSAIAFRSDAASRVTSAISSVSER